MSGKKRAVEEGLESEDEPTWDGIARLGNTRRTKPTKTIMTTTKKGTKPRITLIASYNKEIGCEEPNIPSPN